MKKDTVLWARQYSKRLITFLLIGWAIGAVIGVVYEFIRLISDPATASMDALYIYLAVPLTCGIPSYVIPNIFLNKEKVRQHYIQNYDYTTFGNGYMESITEQNLSNEEIVDAPEEKPLHTTSNGEVSLSYGMPSSIGDIPYSNLNQ